MTTRFPGALLALSAHLLLALTVWRLFPFLMGGAGPVDAAGPGWWWLDGLLVVQFALPHSLLLHPTVRRRLGRVLPKELLGCVFTLATALSLLLLTGAWRASPVVVWSAGGWARPAVQAGYLLSWAGLLWCLGLEGFGRQTGWTPFWAWFRGRPVPQRRFEARGPYRLLRHPSYLCFLGQVWLTPDLTLDRALLGVLLTGYVAVGSCLKDRRMLVYVGDAYRRYSARVPGYPLLGGRLGRVPLQGAVSASMKTSIRCPTLTTAPVSSS
jgi:hypothetical protein